MEARLERRDREIEALAPQIEAALAIAQQPGASPLAAEHYRNLVAEKKQLIASRDTLEAQLLSAAGVQPAFPDATGLAEKMEGTLRKVFKEYLSEQQERISVTMSKASGVRLMEVAKRLGSPLQRGLLFTTHKPFLQPKQKFKWPRSGGAEDEVAGYSDAITHAFVSVCTDLVAGWGMFSNRDHQLCLTEKAESPAGQGFPKFNCSAILDVRNALAKSAATLRKIRKAIAAGPLVSAGGVSGEGGEGNGGSGSNNEPSDSRGNDAGNTQPNSDPAASQQAAPGSSAPKAVSNSEPALRSKQRSAASLDDCVLQRMLGDDEGLREVEALHSIAVVNLLRSDLGYRGLLGRTGAPKSIHHPTLSELWQHPLSQHAQLVRDTMDAALQEEPALGVDAAAGEA